MKGQEGKSETQRQPLSEGRGVGTGSQSFGQGTPPPPTHTPLLLDPPGLREVALRPTSVTWAIYQTLCASVCPTAKWANKHVCLYEVVRRT